MHIFFKFMGKENSEKYDGLNDVFDSIITDFAKVCSSNHNADLFREIVTTISKLGGEISDRGDLQLINNALKDLQ